MGVTLALLIHWSGVQVSYCLTEFKGLAKSFQKYTLASASNRVVERAAVASGRAVQLGTIKDKLASK